MWRSKRTTPVPKQPEAPPTPTPVEQTPVAVLPEAPTPLEKATPTPVVKAVPAPQKMPSVPIAPVAPPPVELHKELIPKDIEIVRVYYAQPITGPGSLVEFDINGTGFNQEFERMIKVDSGSSNVSVKNLKLMTPNQIQGVLVVKSDAKTGAVFPQVLIQDKVVFRAPEPYAVIRPGEVLNMVFTEMGESGRSGRFRVFTNLTQNMFDAFRVSVDTTSITVSDLVPHLPFVVDGTLTIGSTREGDFGIQIFIGETLIWDKPGIIRVVQPNVGQSGLAQQLRAIDGFHRPGDEAHFALHGSGFQESDADILDAVVDGWGLVPSTFTYRSAGRMELTIRIPESAAVGAYTLRVKHDQKELLAVERAFRVVGENWLRRFVVDPPLQPGKQATLRLEGRDLGKEFVASLVATTDTDDLKVGTLSQSAPELIVAPISAGESLAAGDYLIHVTSNGKPVVAQFGNIIRIVP